MLAHVEAVVLIHALSVFRIDTALDNLLNGAGAHAIALSQIGVGDAACRIEGHGFVVVELAKLAHRNLLWL